MPKFSKAMKIALLLSFLSVCGGCRNRTEYLPGYEKVKHVRKVAWIKEGDPVPCDGYFYVPTKEGDCPPSGYIFTPTEVADIYKELGKKLKVPD